MNIALVLCPNPVLEVPTAHFPQGILYIGNVLRRAGHKVRLVDLRDKSYVVEDDIPEVDCIGITATSGEIHFARQIAKIARKRGTRTIIGGAHATFMPEDCLEDFDAVIKGDGEMAVLEALKGRRGIFFHPFEPIGMYFPDWQLAGMRGFSKELFTGAGYGQGPLAAGIISGRGCAFNCAYCRSERVEVRYRPINEVIFELEDLKKRWDISHFRFYDDNLTLNKKRALELFKEMERLQIKFRAHTRSDLWDDEIAESAKRAGLEEMGFGFESASNTVLAKMRKQETVEQHRSAIKICKRHEIICKAFWMTSLPLEHWESIEAIKTFMLEERPDRWILSNFCPYPGSDIWQYPEIYGVVWMERDLSKYWNFSDDALIEYEDVSRDELVAHYRELRLWLSKEFPKSA